MEDRNHHSPASLELIDLGLPHVLPFGQYFTKLTMPLLALSLFRRGISNGTTHVYCSDASFGNHDSTMETTSDKEILFPLFSSLINVEQSGRVRQKFFASWGYFFQAAIILGSTVLLTPRTNSVQLPNFFRIIPPAQSSQRSRNIFFSSLRTASFYRSWQQNHGTSFETWFAQSMLTQSILEPQYKRCRARSAVDVNPTFPPCFH